MLCDFSLYRHGRRTISGRACSQRHDIGSVFSLVGALCTWQVLLSRTMTCPLQDALCVSPVIKFATVVGQDCKHLGALIVTDAEALAEAAAAQGGQTAVPNLCTTRRTFSRALGQ
jgi:hypothetical protein